MRSGSVVVNTARGTLIDPAALAVGLAGGAPQVAALDVFSPEPPDLRPYRDVMDQMILTPHMAWYTEESQADLRRKSAEEALRTDDRPATTQSARRSGGDTHEPRRSSTSPAQRPRSGSPNPRQRSSRSAASNSTVRTSRTAPTRSPPS